MILNVNYINEEIIKDAAGFIARCEEKHKLQYDKILNLINERLPKLRIVCIAGPSSSENHFFKGSP